MKDLSYYLKFTRVNEDDIDEIISELSQKYSEQYEYAISPFDIIIASSRADIIYRDDIPYRCVVDYNTKVKESRVKDNYIREVWTYHKDNFKVGDFVYLENKVSKTKEPYLFVSCIESKDGYDVGYIQRVTNFLHFYDENSILYEIPYVVESKESLYSMGTDDDLLTVPSSVVIIKIPDNEITSKIKRGDIFKLRKDNYEVIDINGEVRPGLLVLRMEFSEKEQTILSQNYSISILNGKSINLRKGETFQLNVEVFNNGVKLLSPSLSYQSSDPSIATVEDGFVTCRDVGIVDIIVTFNDISEYVTINVQENVVSDNYTILILGDSVVKLNDTIILLANVYNNGILDNSKSIEWEIYNKDGSNNNYLSILSQDKNSITLKATNKSTFINKQVVVKASIVGEVNNYTEHIIQIKGLI